MRPNTNEFLKTIRHSKPSYLLSLDDELIKPNYYILQLISDAILNIPGTNFDNLRERFDKKTFKWLNTWPGEHYKLLYQLMIVEQPNLILEIGTFKGASCLAMKQALLKYSQYGKIITYDIIPWNNIKGTHLRKEDFDKHLEQRVVDFSKLDQIKTQEEVFRRANFIFVDMAKDGVSEKLVCDFLDSLNFNLKNGPYVIFDDIKFVSMLKFWREIKHPKMDITSLGHWSGTGIVHWV